MRFMRWEKIILLVVREGAGYGESPVGMPLVMRRLLRSVGAILEPGRTAAWIDCCGQQGRQVRSGGRGAHSAGSAAGSAGSAAGHKAHGCTHLLLPAPATSPKSVLPSSTLQQVRHILALFTLALNSPPNAVTAVHRADRALPADVHCAQLHVPSYSSEMAT